MAVTAAKPAIGGAIYVAALGTTLPTDASTAPTSFTSLNAISDAGLTRAIEQDTTVVKAWGGDTVLVLDNGKTETFQFGMLDAHSVDALKILYGDSNVTGTTLSGGITVKSNNTERVGHAFVVDMVESGSTLHRICIPDGIVTEIEDITYVDNEAVVYGVTITAIADSSKNTSYDYFKTAAAST